MRAEDASVYTEKCIIGEPAPCSNACPFGLDVRSFLEKAGKGKWNTAYKSLRNAVVFPVIVSTLCPSPCEKQCQRTKIGDEPIATRMVESACIKHTKNQKPDSYVIPPKTERIAIIGAGAAGLSAALCIAQKNYMVTVFDRSSNWGGSLRAHPNFKDFDADIALQFSSVTPEFKYGVEIKSLAELDEFDMIYVATGAGGRDFGLLSGWDSKYLNTHEPKVFLGGALTGADTITGIAQGKSVSKTAEYFLQTGKAYPAVGNVASVCSIAPPIAATPPAHRIIPADPCGYTEDEAKAEALRCMNCDCDRCLKSCEMLDMFRKKPKKIAMEVYADTQVNPPFSSHTITRQAYSCNMCGHCTDICPMDIDLGGLLRLSREARTQDPAYPEALHDYWLREMDFSIGDASFFAPPKNNSKCDYVFFPGCQLGAHNPAHVIESYKFLEKIYNTGIFTGCCGAPAYWAGDNDRQNTNFEEIRKIWRELDKAAFVFACATCESLFQTFLPEIPHVSLYELMAQSDEICAGRIYDNASVFDPCNARGSREMERAVRKLAETSGAKLTELPEKNRCCGYGGHMSLANPDLYSRITENRAGLGNDPYIVYCANCREVFLSRKKECTHILDIALDLPYNPILSKIHEKRENALKVKSTLMKHVTGADFVPEVREWDSIQLNLSDELANSIEKKLISQNDIKETIWYAEKSGDLFVDESGTLRCCLQKPVITFWVAYKKSDGDEREILEAYSHRMKFSIKEAVQ